MDRTGYDGGYVVGWGTLALINAALAQTKNRSRLAWFLLSMFFGPIATLASLCQPRLGHGCAGRGHQRLPSPAPVATHRS